MWIFDRRMSQPHEHAKFSYSSLEKVFKKWTKTQFDALQLLNLSNKAN